MSYVYSTTGYHLPIIVREGKIRTTLISDEKNGKPFVWLTRNKECDNACNAGVVTNAHELVGKKIIHNDDLKTETLNFEATKFISGVCRVKISKKLPVTTWAKYKQVGGVSERYLNELETITRENGDPIDLWVCSFKPITSDYFESIEMVVGNKWVAWDGSCSIEEFVELCYSCNTKDALPVEVKPQVPASIIGQMDFLSNHEKDIIKLWEENKHKNGYLDIIVMGDYDTMFPNFVEGKFWKKNFLNPVESKSGNYIYVQFHWFDTKTSYKACLAYEPETGFTMIPNEVRRNHSA